MDYQLQGKTALISGSTSGIGFAIAKTLSLEGAKVIINGRDETRISAAINKIKATAPQAELISAVGDLSRPESIEALYQRIPEVDILVNNLGVYEQKAFQDILDVEWQRLFDVNVMSGVRLSRNYFPGMLKRNWGRIIFISSESALQIPVDMVHYGMTKTAQLAIARGLAEMTTGTQVTVNSVLPGPTRSEGVEQFVKNMASELNQGVEQIEKDFFTNVRPSSLIQRFTSPEEVAALVAYVASPISSGTNGAALHVDGGIVRAIA
jgi:NAD(P)-dependent dehydrogenase (short-subunit alcohol dehydrogenase family)